MSALSSNLQQDVSSAVQAALSEALPQELAGPQLQAALEASLGKQLQQALARPLQDTFTAAFQHQLIPSFECACRDMFAQVRQHSLSAAVVVLTAAVVLTAWLAALAHLYQHLRATAETCLPR